MKFIKSKKGRALLAVLVVAAVASFGAYAYFTSTGSGTGTATVGTAANNLYVHGTVTGLLLPGGPSRTVSFTADNPANFAQSISKIHLASIGACSVAWDYSGGDIAPSCPASSDTVGDLTATCGSVADGSLANTPLTKDFYMADVTVDPATDGNIAANAAPQVMSTTGTIVMNDASYDQAGCKGAYLNLNFSTT